MAITTMITRSVLLVAIVAATIALQSQVVTVNAQPLTTLSLPEIITDPRYADQFTILAAMFEKWFTPDDLAQYACDSGNNYTFFAPTDLAWDNSWLLVNSQTLDRQKLIDYYSIPETLTYHLLPEAIERNALLPTNNLPVKKFTVNGSYIKVYREQDQAGVAYPKIAGGFAGNNITLNADVQILTACAGSVVYIINEQTLLPPQPQPNVADAQTVDWLVAPGGTSLLFQIGLQQTDLYSDDENGNTRGLPECIIAGQRAPFSACTPKPISEILGYCPNLAFSNPGRDPIAQEMNQVFQNRVSNDTLGATPIPPVTCPGSTPYNYYNNGVTFSLTLLDFCGLIPAIDAPDANLTVFLPTNNAWLKATEKAVPPISPASLTAPPYSAWICDLIKYHAVPGKLQFFEELAVNNATYPTLAGDGFDVIVRRRVLETKINQSSIVALSSQGEGTIMYRIDFPLSPGAGPSFFGVDD